jgi:hypothetical protein
MSTVVPDKKGSLSTILLLVGVAIVVGGLLALYGALGFSIGLTAFGSLFLLYWAGIQHQAWGEFLPSLVGGLVGIGLAWLLLTAPTLWGSAGAAASFAVLAVVLYFYLRGEGRLVVNNASMLLLLVATIPELRVGETAPKMAAALVIGAIWIGTISWIADVGRKAMAKRSQATASKQP